LNCYHGSLRRSNGNLLRRLSPSPTFARASMGCSRNSRASGGTGGNGCRTPGIASRGSARAACPGCRYEEKVEPLLAEDRRRKNYETLRVCRFMKSIRMNCPRVMVLVKYAFPLQIEATCLTNSTRLRSRASMKVLIMMPLRLQLDTSR
jgi:hypothetical protein